jgi:hypothetical protein
MRRTRPTAALAIPATGIEHVKKQPHPIFEKSTEASPENRDARGDPLPKPPRPPAPPEKSAPARAWDRMLGHGRRHATVASISSLLRFRRLALRTPEITALREPVRQFRGLGVAIQMAGLAGWALLWWAFDLTGAVIGAAVCLACGVIGRARSKPWRCGNCKTPLTTAKVRVCPGCCARLIDSDAKVMPRAP